MLTKLVKRTVCWWYNRHLPMTRVLGEAIAPVCIRCGKYL